MRNLAWVTGERLGVNKTSAVTDCGGENPANSAELGRKSNLKNQPVISFDGELVPQTGLRPKRITAANTLCSAEEE